MLFLRVEIILHPSLHFTCKGSPFLCFRTKIFSVHGPWWVPFFVFSKSLFLLTNKAEHDATCKQRAQPVSKSHVQIAEKNTQDSGTLGFS